MIKKKWKASIQTHLNEILNLLGAHWCKLRHLYLRLQRSKKGLVMFIKH